MSSYSEPWAVESVSYPEIPVINGPLCVELHQGLGMGSLRGSIVRASRGAKHWDQIAFDSVVRLGSSLVRLQETVSSLALRRVSNWVLSDEVLRLLVAHTAPKLTADLCSEVTWNRYTVHLLPCSK